MARAFSNQVIKPKRFDKPHIVLIKNFWRVSPMVGRNVTAKLRWKAAHKFVTKLNLQE